MPILLKRVLLVTILIVIPSRAFPLDSPQFMLQWGSSGTGNGQFNRTAAVAIDSLGFVYVSDIWNARIQKFTSDGAYVTQWGSHGTGPGQFFQRADGICIGSNGDVYATTLGSVQRFTNQGAFIQKWTGSGTVAGKFKYPMGCACDSDGSVYVVDLDADRVQKFTANGAFLLSWGTSGSNPGQFNGANVVALDASGNVYVNEISNGRVQVFRSDSAFVRSWSNGSGGIDGMAIDPYGHVYAASYGNSYVTIFDTTGTFWYRWGGVGAAPGQFNGCIGVAINPSDGIFVADGDNHRVQKFAFNTTVATPSSSTRLALSVRAIGSPSRRSMPNLRIVGRPAEAFSVDVTDVRGRQRQRFSGTTDAAGSVTIPRSKLGPCEPGMYFTTIRQGTSIATTKFVILP